MKNALLAPGLLLVTCLSAAAEAIPRFETYFGYSFVRFESAGVVPAFNANGGNAQLIYNFKPRLGFVGDFGGYHHGSIGGFALDNTVVNFQVGPRFSLLKKKKVSPYVQALFGGALQRASVDILPLPALPLNRTDVAFAMLVGGGVDIKLTRHIAFRPVEADYFFSRLRNPAFQPDRSQNNFRYSGGVAFLFGAEKPTPTPPQAATKVCPDGSTVLATAPCPKIDLTLGLTAASTEICEGETVSLSPKLGGSKGGVGYQWSVNGQPVSQGKDFVFSTTGLAPGTYRIAVAASGVGYNPASSEVVITVKDYQPPTGTVQANPSELYVGEKAKLSASFQGQCGGPIQPPVYTASEGTVQDSEYDSSGVQFDPSVHSEQRKPVSITATAKDNRSSGTATATVTVIQKPTMAAVRLPDILFPHGSARVNNCGKRVLLEQLRTYFERDPGGKVVLVGHNAADETAPKLAEERVRNAAAVITAGSGICLSVPADQVLVSAAGTEQGGVSFQPNFCGASTAGGTVSERPGQAVSANDKTAEVRRVEVWFVPTGAQLPESVANSQTAAALNVGALGCPK